MKKIVLKNWFENTLIAMMFISLGAIITTADSELSIEYIIFVVINLIVFASCSLTIVRFGR